MADVVSGLEGPRKWVGVRVSGKRGMVSMCPVGGAGEEVRSVLTCFMLWFSRDLAGGWVCGAGEEGGRGRRVEMLG